MTQDPVVPEPSTTTTDPSTTKEGSSAATQSVPVLHHDDMTVPTGNTISVTDEGTTTVLDPDGVELYPPTYAPIPDVPEPPANGEEIIEEEDDDIIVQGDDDDVTVEQRPSNLGRPDQGLPPTTGLGKGR